MIYFTSDQHWGHTKIITLCNRNFPDTHTMNVHMVECWNSVIKPYDEVYFLGDFGLCTKKSMAFFLYKLNGKKYFIKGNHDKTNILNWMVNTNQIEWWDYDHEFQYEYKGVKYTFILSHYQHQPQKDNVICLYGHSHGKSKPVKGSMDVGVDSVGYVPLSIEQIIQKIFEV